MSVFGGNRKSSKRSHLYLSCSGYGDRFCHRLRRSRSTFAKSMLLPLPFTQAEIEAEHWLKCFCFAMLKLTDIRWIYRSESGSNLFHLGALPPD
ncbi:MAG: hypothetical protein DME91_08950 [Verrucomicrobia bacterium]|nr:MAG: hypothetical protein DME91_08950 [Verrucomicrobiota bacterium]